MNGVVQSRTERKLPVSLVAFLTLQLLDLVTTLLVFQHGGVELNPVVRSLIPFMGRAMAVFACKATLVVVICAFSRRSRVLLFADVFYAGIVIWNLIILTALK
jgi:Na+/alanine symporter